MAVPHYVVPNVPLIPQQSGMACWYASTQMLITWRRRITRSTEAALPDPSEVPDAVELYKENNGLSFSENIHFAKLMGLDYVPLMSPTLEAIAGWLFDYGPIWAAGYKETPTNRYGHVFVIVGVGPDQLVIYDPEPVHQGSVLYESPSWLDTLLDVGRFPEVVTNFLHCPA